MTDLRNWTPPQMARDAVLQGRYARLEPLDAARHGAVLHQAYGQDAGVWTYMPYGPFASQAAYHRHVSESAAWDHTWFYAVRDQDQGKWLGVASYLRDDPANGVIEVGHIAFSPDLQRRRAGTEAIYLMMRQAFEAGYRRFEWKCDARNRASRRAAQRYGFNYEGMFAKHMIIKGQNRDTAWFACVDDDWPALQEAYEAWLSPANFDAAGQQRERLADLTRLVRRVSDPEVPV